MSIFSIIHEGVDYCSMAPVENWENHQKFAFCKKCDKFKSPTYFNNIHKNPDDNYFKYLEIFGKKIIIELKLYTISDIANIIYELINIKDHKCESCRGPKWCLHPNCLENMTSFDSNNKLHKHIRDCH